MTFIPSDLFNKCSIPITTSTQHVGEPLDLSEIPHTINKILDNLKPLKFYLDKFSKCSWYNQQKITQIYEKIYYYREEIFNIDIENLNLNCYGCANCNCCINCVNCLRCYCDENCKISDELECSLDCQNCNYSTDCIKCTNCRYINNCKNCNSCRDCNNCNNCVDCCGVYSVEYLGGEENYDELDMPMKDCDNCVNCVACKNCKNLHNSSFCCECKNCVNCKTCYGSENKCYLINNDKINFIAPYIEFAGHTIGGIFEKYKVKYDSILISTCYNNYCYDNGTLHEYDTVSSKITAYSNIKVRNINNRINDLSKNLSLFMCYLLVYSNSSLTNIESDKLKCKDKLNKIDDFEDLDKLLTMIEELYSIDEDNKIIKDLIDDFKYLDIKSVLKELNEYCPKYFNENLNNENLNNENKNENSKN